MRKSENKKNIYSIKQNYYNQRITKKTVRCGDKKCLLDL